MVSQLLSYMLIERSIKNDKMQYKYKLQNAKILLL